MVRMSSEILNVINAVRDYKRFIISNQYIYLEDGFNWYEATEKYYYSLPLPEGMEKDKDDLRRILTMDVNILAKLNRTGNNDLKLSRWK